MKLMYLTRQLQCSFCLTTVFKASVLHLLRLVCAREGWKGHLSLRWCPTRYVAPAIPRPPKRTFSVSRGAYEQKSVGQQWHSQSLNVNSRDCFLFALHPLKRLSEACTTLFKRINCVFPECVWSSFAKKSAFWELHRFRLFAPILQPHNYTEALDLHL